MTLPILDNNLPQILYNFYYDFCFRISNSQKVWSRNECLCFCISYLYFSLLMLLACLLHSMFTLQPRPRLCFTCVLFCFIYWHWQVKSTYSFPCLSKLIFKIEQIILLMKWSNPLSNQLHNKLFTSFQLQWFLVWPLETGKQLFNSKWSGSQNLKSMCHSFTNLSDYIITIFPLSPCVE